jgi:tetrapyrrole methylase family protein/MazG family protein
LVILRAPVYNRSILSYLDSSREEPRVVMGGDPRGGVLSETDGMAEKAAAFRALEEIIERLRGPQGCPWDRAQTLLTMAPNLLEEACEVVDAITEAQGGPAPGVCEELGDLLMNILLSARISEEGGGFGFRKVAEAIAAKLVRRHPHVFGPERVASVEEVLLRWNAIKGEEKGELKQSRLGTLPRSLPALASAAKLGERAARVGFDWPDAAGALLKVEEEVREVAQALPSGGEPLEHELGDLLFATASLARKSGVDPEAALRSALERFRKRFHYIEKHTDVSRASLEEMEELWNAAKSDGS